MPKRHQHDSLPGDAVKSIWRKPSALDPCDYAEGGWSSRCKLNGSELKRSRKMAAFWKTKDSSWGEEISKEIVVVQWYHLE